MITIAYRVYGAHALPLESLWSIKLSLVLFECHGKKWGEGYYAISSLWWKKCQINLHWPHIWNRFIDNNMQCHTLEPNLTVDEQLFSTKMSIWLTKLTNFKSNFGLPYMYNPNIWWMDFVILKKTKYVPIIGRKCCHAS